MGSDFVAVDGIDPEIISQKEIMSLAGEMRGIRQMGFDDRMSVDADRHEVTLEFLAVNGSGEIRHRRVGKGFRPGKEISVLSEMEDGIGIDLPVSGEVGEGAGLICVLAKVIDLRYDRPGRAEQQTRFE